MIQSIREKYYLDGYTFGHLSGHGGLRQVLEDLVYGPPRDGFRWESKYPNTFDLRPNAHAYHPNVMDVLFTSGVPELLSHVVGADMVMFHVQVRRSLRGPSYMDWHRDTYVHGAKAVGNLPPVHKLIWYPTLGLRSTPKLKLSVGSHRRTFGSQREDIDGLKDLPYAEYASSDDQFVLFDTSMMHGVVPDVDDLGSIRIIYSFIRRVQYEDDLSDQPLHREQVEEYTRRLG